MKLSTWRDLVGSEPSFQEVELYETGDEEGGRLARHVKDEPGRFPRWIRPCNHNNTTGDATAESTYMTERPTIYDLEETTWRE
jgi:hypothetical protein